MHTEEVGTPYTENVQQITKHHSIALITLNDGLVNTEQYSPDGRMAQTATDTKAHCCQLIIGHNHMRNTAGNGNLLIKIKIALLTYKVMNGMAPQYLGPFVRVADLPGRRALYSAVTNRLTVPAVKLSTIGSRAFSVSGPQMWNQLPEEITSATSLSTFQTF